MSLRKRDFMRTILHIDMNNFYASVECLYRPEIRHLPVAVAGDPLNRHGIILAKNMLAKKLGVKTGEAIWQAKLKAPELVTVPPDFRKYLKFSRLARQILYDYTNQIEPFGIDENWADVTGSELLCGDGSAIANSIRLRIKEELGCHTSLGVSNISFGLPNRDAINGVFYARLLRFRGGRAVVVLRKFYFFLQYWLLK